jgi:hypothetical protein
MLQIFTSAHYILKKNAILLPAAVKFSLHDSPREAADWWSFFPSVSVAMRSWVWGDRDVVV